MNNSINCSGFDEMFIDAEKEQAQVTSHIKAATLNNIDSKFKGE